MFNRWLLIVCLLPALALTAEAQSTPNVERLQKRVTDLEAKVQFLEEALRTLVAAQGPAPAATTPSPRPAVDEDPARVTEKPVTEVAATRPPRDFYPPDLIPEIGKIGAEAGLIAAGSINPFSLNNGSYFGGYVDLPMLESSRMRGKLAYEISIGMSQSKTSLRTTSNVAQVANLAVLNALAPGNGVANIANALAGTGASPFPVTTASTTKLKLLEVVPFSVKYTTTAFDRWRLRPYAVLGLGMYVTIHNQTSTGTCGVRTDAALPAELVVSFTQQFCGKAPFGAALTAGQIAQSPELEALGLPSGHGNLNFGLHSGFGLEYRITPSLSLGFDQRINKIAASPGLLTTFGTRIGVHF